MIEHQNQTPNHNTSDNGNRPRNHMQRVMSYNLHSCVGTDRRYDPERVLRVIDEVNPTILGLQEVRANTPHTAEILELIQQEYPDYHSLFVQTFADDKGAFGNALVTPYPITEHLNVDLRPENAAAWSARSAEARRAVFAKLDIAGRPLWVIVTHLGVEWGVRKQQARTLLGAINRRIDLETEATVFMGDFNEWIPPNAFVRSIDRTFSKHVARRTFPSYAPLLPLDRIWMTAHLRGIHTWAHRSPLARRASDHLPLCLEFNE